MTQNSSSSPDLRNGATRTDVVVVGAGGMGSAAAYHLTKDGRRVLLLEQFELGHKRGSSHGGSRIIRYSQPTMEYAQVMPATVEMWRALERDTGQTLLGMIGGLYMAPPNDEWVTAALAIHQELGQAYQYYESRELRQAFPQFRPPDDWVGFHQADSGILSATDCVLAMARWAAEHGAQVREESKVLSITPDGDGVTVRYVHAGREETVLAKQAVVTAGAWAPGFIQALLGRSLPLRVTHQQVAYFAATRPDLYAADKCPVYIFTADPHVYGFPIWERDGCIKIAREFDATTDPDGPREVHPVLLQGLAETVAEILPGVDPTPVHAEACLYTETANRDFIIDRHPEHPQILLAAGFSGRGFKFAVSVGRLLADLAATEPGIYDSPFWLDLYRLDRFEREAS